MPRRVSRVAANVRAELARRGLRQADLAGAVGLSQQAISRRLLGATPFKIDELNAIALVLDVSVRDLLPARYDADHDC